MLARQRKPGDFRAEIEAHIALEAERLRAQGLGEKEALAAARRAFGSVTSAEERFYESGRWVWWDHCRADIRYGARMLLKNPGFTAIAVLMLALGIGANAAIFTVFDAALLRALPVSQPGQLVVLTDPNSHGHLYGEEDGTRDLLAFSEFEYLRDGNAVFSGIFAADSSLPEVPVRIGGSSQQTGTQGGTARVRLVSGDYFSTLGVAALRGRVFGASEDRVRGAAPVAVISYDFWDRRFGLDPDVVGKTIEIRRTPFSVIGVAPPGFFGETVGDSPDLWVPLLMQAAVYPGQDMISPVPALQNAHVWLQVMARLRPGVTLKQAQADIAVSFRRMLEAQAGPALTPHQRQEFLNQRIQLQPGARGLATVRGPMGDPLKILLGLTGLVLLIACANVANLLLARGSARQREFAIRAAIGAGRSRLVRQLLVESFVLAFLGAGAGVVLARWAGGVLVRIIPGDWTAHSAVRLDLALDARVILFTLAVAVLTALLFGSVPAWRAGRVDVLPVLKSAGPGSPGGAASRRPAAGKLLVVGQVATSLVLLVAAGLFVHSLIRLGAVSLGYRPEKLLLVPVDTAAAGYQGDAVTGFYRGMLERLAAIPGVSAASVSTNGLFEGHESADPIAVEGYAPPGGNNPHSRMDHVGPGYFRAIGIPILLGRGIEPGDAAPGRRVAVINQAFVQTYFAHTNPLGKTVRDVFPGNPGAMVVVGVAGNARANSLREPLRPRIFIPLFNPLWPHSAVTFEVRTQADPAAVAAAIREMIEQTNQALLPVRIDTLPALVQGSLGSDRFIARLSGAFAVLAALLAAIGLYGVMAYAVARRTREIGIRMALGAAPAGILRVVLGETLLVVSIGIALGVPIAVAGTRLIRSLLFGVGVVDPGVLAAAALVLAAAAALAGLMPALRAARIDPMAAVRYD